MKGDFCRQVRQIVRARESGGGLPRDRPRHRGLLQPAAQRSRSVRGRVRDWQSAEQLVRQIERAVLAAGVHGSPQVRHLVATDYRRLHHARGGVPLHHRRRAHREEHPIAESAVRQPAGRPRDQPRRVPGADAASAVDAVGAARRDARGHIRTMRSSKRTRRA